MVTIYNHHLVLFAIGFIILLLLPFINCTNDQIKETSIDRNIRTTTTTRENRLYNILKQAKLSSNSYEEEEIKHLIADFFKNYPHRRASSFHAMRGKRSIKTD